MLNVRNTESFVCPHRDLLIERLSKEIAELRAELKRVREEVWLASWGHIHKFIIHFPKSLKFAQITET